MKFAFVVLIFILAIVFTWTNGFQHASTVAAPAIGCKSISHKKCVLIIFVFELLGTLCGGSAVADAVQSLSKWPHNPTFLPVVCSALLAATVWNFAARRLKQPASSTHALLGAVTGALVAGAGGTACVSAGHFDLLHPSGVIGAVISLFLSPLLGVVSAYVIFSLMFLIFFRAPHRIIGTFSKLQGLGTALLAFGDGQNDTQKTMGLLVLSFNCAGYASGQAIPIWMRLLIGTAMGAGAFFMSPGLVNQLARHVFRLTKGHALAAEIAGSGTLIANSIVGGPVSSSQVVAAAIVGGALPKGMGGVHWMVVRSIILSWLVTLPTNALLAAIFYGGIFKWFARAL